MGYDIRKQTQVVEFIYNEHFEGDMIMRQLKCNCNLHDCLQTNQSIIYLAFREIWLFLFQLINFTIVFCNIGRLMAS